MPVMTYRQALNDTLGEELARDPNVLLMGEEIGKFQGSYRITEGLLAEFGTKRVVDTPIAEEGLCRHGDGRGNARPAPGRRNHDDQLHPGRRSIRSSITPPRSTTCSAVRRKCRW